MRNRIVAAGIVLVGASTAGAALASPPQDACVYTPAVRDPGAILACLRDLRCTPCPVPPRQPAVGPWPSLHY